MKVKCIENKSYENYLTIGKTYEVININDNSYRIIDDDEYDIGCYHKSYFIPLLEDQSSMYNPLEDES